MRIGDVLGAKGRPEIITISADASVREMLALLAEHNIGALIVSSDGVTVEGIVSERDVVRRLHEDDSVLEGRVSSIMTTDVRTVAPDAHLDEVRQTMTQHRIRHIPVVADGRLTGIVSIGDVVKQALDELTFERDQLDSYVHQQ